MKIPPEFKNLKGEDLKRYETAPCGPAKALWGVLAWLVPDDLLGLDVRPACAIHDFMYGQGKTKADKIKADRTFFHNLLCLVVKGEEKLMARTVLAICYFVAVRFAGGGAFKGA